MSAPTRDRGLSAPAGLAAALGVVAITSLPYLLGFLAPPAGRVFLGLVFDAPDHAQYWSWVTASRDALFIPNTMTPEPNAASFLNPAMWLLARAQVLFDLSFPALFQWWRIAAAVAIGPALAFLVRTLARTPAQARLAFWVVLAGGGLGWVLVVAKYALGLADAPFPEALYTVEPNTFFGLLAYPYLPLAQAFMLVALGGAFRVHVAPSPAAWAAAGLGALAVALLHAYDLVVVYAVLGVFWLVEAWRARGIPWRFSWAIALVVASSAPLAGYYQYLTSADPLWRDVLAQYVNAGVWTPSPPLLVVLMGAPLALSLVAVRGLAWDEPGTRFTATWALAGTALVYLPTVFQVKLLAAYQVPLALLASGVWTERAGPALRRWLPATAVARAVPACLLALLVLPTNVYLVVWRLVDLRRTDAPYYLTTDEAAALAALAERTRPADVALAPESVGRWVPNYGRTRAVLAHWAMTRRYLERREAVQQFFSTAVDDEWRRRQLTADAVTYVVWTARDAAEGRTYSPARSPALFEPVVETPTAGLFRVKAAR